MSEQFNRPTYLVAVSNGSIYMGYSPNNMTLCTNGEGVLEDTPWMDMQDGPPSPNDEGQQRFHRHMYFADGVRYLKLDAHTGEVYPWTAFNGEDAITNNQVRGFLPFSADVVVQIESLSGGQPVVVGDVTGEVEPGDEIVLQNTQGQDGSYTLSSAILDGGNTLLTLNPNPNLEEAAGVASRVTGRGRIVTLYRNRMVIAGLRDDPNNWFMSAVGDPRNWDYFPAVESVTQAVAGGTGEAGTLGDSITALVPFSDDMMLIGCLNSLWVMQGDPAAGGQIINLSQQVGCVGPDAWAFDPSNNLYLFGSNGLYRISPSLEMERLSAGVLDKTFAEVDLTANRVILQFDRDRDYLFIFITKDEVGAANELSYIFDSRVQAFWPIKLPDENGPTSVHYFASPASNDRGLLMGGRDGFIRGFRDNRPNDNDGVENGEGLDVPINSYVDMGPFALQGGLNYKTGDMHFVLGGFSGPVELEVYAGDTPEQAARATTPRASSQLRLSRARFIRKRVSGQSLRFRLSQNLLNYIWSYEGGHVNLTPAGRTRGVR